MAFPIKQVFHNPNHGGSRPLGDIRGIVHHYTFGENGGDKAILIEGEGRAVSVHFFIADDNDPSATATDKAVIYQCLPLTTIGWSVGAAREPYTNYGTISVEIGNRGNEAPTPLQLAKCDYLMSYLDQKLGRKVPIVSHEEIALPPGRKAGDPGDSWPMANYKKYRRHTPIANYVPIDPVVRTMAVSTNVKVNPNILARNSGKVYKGQTVTMFAYNTKGWRKIRKGDVVGWVKKETLL